MGNRAPLLFALLLLLFFVSTSAGLADISAIQDQLRSVQLKIIGEKLKILQQGVLGLHAGPALVPAPPAAPSAPEPTREELSRILGEQIKTLQGVVASLQPKAIEEEAVRIEQDIGRIVAAAKTASGDQLLVLQDQLNRLIAAHDALAERVRQALEDSLKYKQAVVIGEQIRVLQEKINTLPRTPTGVSALSRQQQTTLTDIQDTIQKLRLKVLQAQVKVIQEKVGQIAR